MSAGERAVGAEGGCAEAAEGPGADGVSEASWRVWRVWRVWPEGEEGREGTEVGRGRRSVGVSERQDRTSGRLRFDNPRPAPFSARWSAFPGGVQRLTPGACA
ncbi:hypothetical protein AB870_13535 [Pandoraea faecigallinarum]|uniref:Uncharacterized protein n=1 Tax=Pandoraea faecigallinarum TaxID=656179 RepID=A0A0H3WT15_9BURK|nr:hypothetical protein AB870_13535 [Pandoraea faecigallinarum]